MTAHQVRDIVAVGVDGSDLSASALDWAAAEARRRGWGLHIVCSYFLPSYTGAPAEGTFATLDDGALLDEARQVVDRAAEHARRTGVEVTTQLDAGDPVHVLVDVSREVGLLVLGSRGHSTFADRLLGTVSSSVPAHAHCPTVVVPRLGTERTFTPVRRVVVGMDGSDSARRALGAASEEARLWGAELTAVAAVPIPTGVSMGWVPDAIDRREVLADVQSALESAVAEATQGTDLATRAHALDGNAAALMAEFSTAVELIVVGTRGRGGFRGLLLGSTSQAVLQYADCPVMVVPMKDARGDRGPTDVPWRGR